jgi:hypothetical protein
MKSSIGFVRPDARQLDPSVRSRGGSRIRGRAFRSPGGGGRSGGGQRRQAAQLVEALVGQ